MRYLRRPPPAGAEAGLAPEPFAEAAAAPEPFAAAAAAAGLVASAAAAAAGAEAPFVAAAAAAAASEALPEFPLNLFKALIFTFAFSDASSAVLTVAFTLLTAAAAAAFAAFISAELILLIPNNFLAITRMSSAQAQAFDNIYKNFSNCQYDAESNLVCGGNWVETSGLKLRGEPAKQYTYGVYGAQGDLQCAGPGSQLDFKKYVNAVFNPAFAPIKRPSMDGGLLSVAPVEPMPAKLLERFQGSVGGSKLNASQYQNIIVNRGGNN